MVQSYLTQYKEYSRGANREQTDLLTLQLKKLEHEIDEHMRALKDVVARGKVAVLRPEDMLQTRTETDPTQPTLRLVPPEQLFQNDGRAVTLRSRVSRGLVAARSDPGRAANGT